MLQILRTNQPLIIIVIAVYALILNLHGFLLPIEWAPKNMGLLSHWLYERVAVNSFQAKMLAVVLLIFQSVLVTFCVNGHKLTKAYSYFPAAFYLIIVGFLGESGTLSPVLLGNTFLIIALMELYGVYKKDAVNGSVFNIGFWLSVGSLFYVPVAIFLVFGFMGMAVLRSFRFREWLVMVIGFLVPLFLLWTWYYATGGTTTFQKLQFTDNFGFLNFAFGPSFGMYVRAGFFAVSFIVVLVQFRDYMYKRNIQTQKYINLLLWASFILCLTTLFQQHVQLEHAIMFALPLSIFLSMTFLNIKTKPIAEFMFLLLFVGVLTWQYHGFLLGLLRG